MNDPAMSVKVLQLVNSAYFGCVRPTTSIQQAVKYLGVELLRGLALLAQVFTISKAPPNKDFSLSEHQRKSLLTARLAQSFVSNPGLSAEAFSVGLFHNIGQVIISQELPESYAQILKEASQSDQPQHCVEQEVLGTTHAEIGAYLLGVWGLPFSIVENVAFHHRPSEFVGDNCEILAAVHVADALVQEAFHKRTKLDRDFLESMGFSTKLKLWQTVADRMLNEAESNLTG